MLCISRSSGARSERGTGQRVFKVRNLLRYELQLPGDQCARRNTGSKEHRFSVLRNSGEIVIQLVSHHASQCPSENKVSVGPFRAAHRWPDVAGGPLAVHCNNRKHVSIDATNTGKGQPLDRLTRRQAGRPAVAFEIYKYDARSDHPGLIPRQFMPPN
jgi:hypothetical protein